MKPRQKGRYFADDIFKCIFSANISIAITIPLKFVSNGPNKINPALIQTKAWRRFKLQAIWTNDG